MSIQHHTHDLAGENESANSQGNIRTDTATSSARWCRWNKKRNGRRGRRGFAGKVTKGQMKGVVIENGPDMAAQYKYSCKNLYYHCNLNTMLNVRYVIENIQKLPDAYFWKVRKKLDKSQLTVTYQVKVGTNTDKKFVTQTLVDETLRNHLMYKYKLELESEREEEMNHKQSKCSVANLIINQLCRSTINQMQVLNKGNHEALETEDLLAVIQ